MTENTTRKRGEGFVFLRGATYWCSFYVDGREHRESTKIKNTGDEKDHKKAEAYLARRIREKHRHEDDLSPFLTARQRKRRISDLMDALETDFTVRGKNSPQNLSNIKRVRDDFGEYRALSLTADAVANYVRDRLAEGYAKASINRILETLRAGYALADLPAPKIKKLPEADNVRQGFFTEVEIRKVLANLPADLADFVLFGWLTGMRKGEIRSLAWADLDGDVLTLRGENAKNGEARTVPCVGELAELIQRRKLARPVKKGETVMLSNLIFHRKARPVREFRKAWATACKKAVVPGRLFHDLRRSAVRDMVRSGVSQHVAMSISGHRSGAMFRRYNITNESDKREALEQMQGYRKLAAEKNMSADSRLVQ